jgi:phosphatidate phosphatase
LIILDNYLQLYLQARISRPLCNRNIILPTIQFALFAMAAAASYSRISAYKHHWSDVVFGAIFGSILGICNVG